MTTERNLSWDKSSPAWLYGTEDYKLAEYETETTSVCTLSGHCLDYGAGSGYWSRILFPWADRFDLVPTPETGVQKGDILKDKIEKRYDVVHARRLISNLAKEDRHEAIWTLYQAVKPGGRLLICDTWEPGRAKVNELRQQFGMNPLPAPKYGKGGLEPDDFLVRPTDTFDIATAYYLWTRVYYPAIFKRECPFDAPLVREHGLVPTGPYEGLAVHRLFVWDRQVTK